MINYDKIKDGKTLTESDFCAPLYHYWQCKINCMNEQELTISYEPVKMLGDKTLDGNVTNTKTYKPDLVLHGGQNSGNNAIACEVKRYINDNDHLIRDFEKLNTYVSNGISSRTNQNINNYQSFLCAVELVYGTDIFKIKQKFIRMTERIQQVISEGSRSRVICIGYGVDSDNNKSMLVCSVDKLGDLNENRTQRNA